jgi:hypothetical protein
VSTTTTSAGRPPGQKKEDAAAEAQPQAASEPETLQPARDDSRAEVGAYVDALRAAEGEVKAVEGRIQELSARLNPMSLTYIYGAGGSNNEENRSTRGPATLLRRYARLSH